MYRIALCDIPNTTLRCSALMLDIANDEKMVFVHVVVFALVAFLSANEYQGSRQTVIRCL